ncbi:hypothetical protein [Lactiplantibacillus plantarum]|uniref:hypothetical protein n=1 Tax=Lactiplantibacillus plantarum TaxID=1590 RepID=UPI002572447F|nr:hypothetical protein [Lactiplantibacillus plantarum]BEI54957.1 hypothetical protein AWA2045_30880 [Lactiplantibacillus plantarum]
MTKTLKQLEGVLWANKKDFHVIASNTEANPQVYSSKAKSVIISDEGKLGLGTKNRRIDM